MANPTASLPLPLSLPRQTPKQAPHAAAQELWLAIYFPQLALEIATPDLATQACAVIHSVNTQNIIHSASYPAQRYGVRPGMTLSAATALCSQLITFTYNGIVQHKRLQQLALWLERYTPKVSLHAPQTILLEIKSSLKLFGGLKRLLRTIKNGLHQHFQHLFNMAVAPTPAAGLLLAANQRNDILLQPQQLRSALGQLPISSLPINIKKKRQLKNIGARRLHDLFRLPHDALARRFGLPLVHYFKQLLGETVQPLTYIQRPQHFSAYYEFPLETHNREHIFVVAQQFFQQLVEFLRARDACITRFEFLFHHNSYHRRAPTPLSLDIRSPSRELEHLLLLFKEKLDAQLLSSPVSGVELYVKQLLPFTAVNTALPFAPRGDHIEQENPSLIDKLLEHLQTRLGGNAIQGMRSIAQHHPDKAHRLGDIIKSNAHAAPHPRPLWLLNTPKPLTLHNGRLTDQGEINILSGPERIETGWWHGGDIRRDYYIALDIHGRRLWIYCDLVKQQWYAHGLFA